MWSFLSAAFLGQSFSTCPVAVEAFLGLGLNKSVNKIHKELFWMRLRSALGLFSIFFLSFGVWLFILFLETENILLGCLDLSFKVQDTL